MANSLSPHGVVVIGSGIGGLSTAIILAKLGYQVTVVEKNRQPGGMMRSYVRRGVHCSVGVHYLGALDQGQVLRRCFDFLGISTDLLLERMGVDGPVDRYYFNDHHGKPDQFDMPAGLDNYEVNLKRAFPQEHDAIDAFMAKLRVSATQMDRLDFLFKDQAAMALMDQTEPLWPLLDRWGCSPRLKSVLCLPSMWIGIPPTQCPQFYHTMTLASYLFSAWRLKRNGAHMASVLTDRLTALGGTLVTADAVQKVQIQDNRVTGVMLESGRCVGANTVVGAIHPKVMMGLLGAEHVKPSFYRRVMGLTDTHGMVAVHALMPRDGRAHLPYNAFLVDTKADGSIEKVIYLQLRPCEQPQSLLLSLITEGHDELWRPWQDTRSGQRGAAYEQTKAELARQLMEKVEPIIGPCDGAEVIDAYTPLSIRDWVNSPGGSAYGVMRSDNQMLSAAMLNRTTVKGLYLAGQSVLAPGVLGTILGSLVTVKFMIGPERFQREIHL